MKISIGYIIPYKSLRTEDEVREWCEGGVRSSVVNKLK